VCWLRQLAAEGPGLVLLMVPVCSLRLLAADGPGCDVDGSSVLVAKTVFDGPNIGDSDGPSVLVKAASR
jgi:hypothetical protein